MKRYDYAIKGGPYGVFITILGEVKSIEECSEYDQITRCIAIEWKPGMVMKGERFCDEDKKSIIEAIKRIEFSDSTLQKERKVICIYSLQYSVCDFQQEGLTVAMMFWCQKYLNANIGIIEARFDNTAKRYSFYQNDKMILGL